MKTASLVTGDFYGLLFYVVASQCFYLFKYIYSSAGDCKSELLALSLSCSLTVVCDVVFSLLLKLLHECCPNVLPKPICSPEHQLSKSPSSDLCDQAVSVLAPLNANQLPLVMPACRNRS